MLKVRFHLGGGQHKGHFQVREGKEVRYYDPAKFQLRMKKGLLHNRPTTAEKINCGEINKTPCSWIRCESLEVAEVGTWTTEGCAEVSYNPKVAPHWRDHRGQNIDGSVMAVLITDGRKVYKGAIATEV